ncbi:hypothetical protein ACFWWS_38540, partial [Streptomyces sp. NPDC059083]|uniref:hypothetical protein n=1 Tax=Streptomyces sp. NPDC059083 TaxID=3346721 RepID=UPI00368F4B50
MRDFHDGMAGRRVRCFAFGRNRLGINGFRARPGVRQQCEPQFRHQFGIQRVQFELFPLLRVLPGADGQHRQSEYPVQQVGLH